MTLGRSRVAVTGIGMVTGLGADTETTVRCLMRGDSAIAPICDVFHRCHSPPMVAEVRERVEACGLQQPCGEAEVTKHERFAVLAAREALGQAGLLTVTVELVLGASTGATQEGVAQCVATDNQSIMPLVARLVAQPIGATGHRIAKLLGNVAGSTVLCSACSSGALAIAIGAMRLEQGRALPQLVGGTDSLNLLTLSGFESLGAQSPLPCRPFDQAHCGLNLGEGAGFLVLETEDMLKRRGGEVLVWLDGYAIGAEAHHLTHPELAGGRAAALMTFAMQRAGLRVEELGYVNAHGTATIANDEMEARALRLALGEHVERVLVSSSKGQIGHTLAAAGAIEAGITAFALIEQAVPPTAGLSHPADACQLRHVTGVAVPAKVSAALSNSFGFGGACAVLAMQHQRVSRPQPTVVASTEPILVTGLGVIGEFGTLRGSAVAAWIDGEFGLSRVPLPFEPLDQLVMERSRRFDRATALTTLACSYLLSDSGITSDIGWSVEPETIGLVLGNALGAVGRSAKFVQRILERGIKGASPAEFPHLLPSSITGNASIYTGLRGPAFNVSDVGSTIQAAVELGVTCIRARMARSMLVGTTECRDEIIVEAGKPRVQHHRPDYDVRQVDANDASAWLLLESQSSAERRGAAGCEIVMAGWCGDMHGSTAVVPGPVSDSLVLCSVEDLIGVRSMMESLGWCDVATRWCQPRVYEGWCHPGFVLACGAALVLAGTTTSTLVLTPSPRGIHCAIFRRA